VNRAERTMNIVCLLFEGITALDIVGPYEVLQRLPDADVTFVAAQAGAIRTDNGFLALVADRTLDEVTHADILVVPGGFATRALEHDESLLAWIRAIDATTTWTTSVCTGSMLLAAAGLLVDLEATSHWASLERLREYGAIPTGRRVVEQGKIVTAAGVSSGIDMALTLAARIGGDELAQAIQLGIEYDPQPPFNAGSLDKAPRAVVERLAAIYTERGLSS
jgi:putative intracellular protease/amidase